MTNYVPELGRLKYKKSQQLLYHILLLRPSHWSKSLIAVSIGPLLLFSEANPGSLLVLIGTIVMFCLASSAVYIINDLSDIEHDKLHASKKTRPLASGVVACGAAYLMLFGIAIVLAFIGTVLPILQSSIVALYVCINLLYSFWLKHVPIVEMLFVAAGFVLRTTAGYLAFKTAPEPWVIVTILAGSLLLIIGKRREELSLISGSSDHRPVLKHYSKQLLDAYLLVAVITCLMASFACIVKIFDSMNLHVLSFLSLPFIIYLFKRYLLLAYMGSKTSNPTKMILSDRPLHCVLLIWAITLGMIASLTQIDSFDQILTFMVES